VKALTVLQPWASLIVGSPTAPPQKQIENRGWKPAEAMLGQRFAIHAGKKLEMDEFEAVFLDKVCGEARAPFATPKMFPLGAVVGVATLDRVIALHHERWEIDADALRWFFGPIGFVLRDRQHLATPVPCKGALGFWELPADVERAVVEQLGAAP
jgi:hypothetical protein